LEGAGMRTLPLRLALMACVPAVIAAPAARADTLAEAVAYAYETDPGLLAQRAALRAIDENYVQARAGMGLQASATATGANNVTEERLLGQEIQKRDQTASYAFSVVQPL